MKKTIISIGIILLICLACFAQSVQNSEKLIVLTSDLKNVNKLVNEYKIARNSLDELLKLERPKLIFVISNQKKIEFENSHNLKKVIDDYWKVVLEYNFKTYLLNSKEQRKQRKQRKITSLWGKHFSKLSKKLNKLQIKTSGSKRKIHYAETLRVVIFLNSLAVGLVAKSKQSGNNYKDIQIINQPKPDFGNCVEKSGSIELRVTFDESAKISKVLVVKSSGCNDFDFNAVEAAKKIEFTPATLDEKPTTVSSTIVYRFNK